MPHVSVAQLRAAGLSDKQIITIYETAETEALARRREQNRIAARNYRARQKAEQYQQPRHQYHADAADAADAVSPPLPSLSSPPSMVSPYISPSLTTPSLFPSEPPISNQKKEKLRKEKEKVDAEFDRFWAVYPRHNAKPVAKRAFQKALEKTSIETILTALQRQLPLWDDPQYIPYPATWLNQERWKDERTLSNGPRRNETFAERAERLTEAVRRFEAEQNAGRAYQHDGGDGVNHQDHR
jgi:hypothetical protein